MTKDLVVLVADKNMEFGLRALLDRHQSLGIRALDKQIFVHPERDPGCFKKGDDYLRSMQRGYAHALLVMDMAGSGSRHRDRLGMEQDLENRLAATGWSERAAAIVIDPELENWVWTGSPHMSSVIRWQDALDIGSWVQSKGYLKPKQIKPESPKEAFEHVLRHAKVPRSSSIYEKLALQVSLKACEDPAFEKFKRVLRDWFPKGVQVC